MKRLFRSVQRQRARAQLSALIWSAVAALSLVAALSAALSEPGRERMAALFKSPVPGFAERAAERIADEDIASLSAQLVKLRSEMRLLALENQAIGTKLARLESDEETVTTASLPDPEHHAELTASATRQTYPPLPRQGGADRRVDTPADRTRYALEIGSGADLDELRALWALLSGSHAAILADLEPKFGIVNSGDGGSRLLLRAGPIADAADALEACATLRQRGTACSPVSDGGNALVMR